MRSAGDRAGEGNALNNLAVAYAHTGEKAKALALFAQAEQIFHELQDRRMIAEVSGNLGVTYDNLGEYQKALESHENDLALKRELGDRASQAGLLEITSARLTRASAHTRRLSMHTWPHLKSTDLWTTGGV